MGSIRIGVDIGGTFTDITVLDEASRKITIAKVPSRKGDPAAALVDLVERGIKLANVDASDVSMLVHGSTIVTNAILENKLPKTALVTTGGFRDLLEIGRHFRPDMYDLQQDKPVPVVPRERCFTIPERTAADGTVLLEPKTKISTGWSTRSSNPAPSRSRSAFSIRLPTRRTKFWCATGW